MFYFVVFLACCMGFDVTASSMGSDDFVVASRSNPHDKLVFDALSVSDTSSRTASSNISFFLPRHTQGRPDVVAQTPSGGSADTNFFISQGSSSSQESFVPAKPVNLDALVHNYRQTNHLEQPAITVQDPVQEAIRLATQAVRRDREELERRVSLRLEKGSSAIFK